MDAIFEAIRTAGFSTDGLAISADGTITFHPDYAHKAEVQNLVTPQWDALIFGGQKAEAVKTVRAACETYILKAYSYAKQLNIIRQGLGYTPEDLTQMTAFIDEARAICEGAVVQINATTTTEELQTLMTSLEAAYGNDVSV